MINHQVRWCTLNKLEISFKYVTDTLHSNLIPLFVFVTFTFNFRYPVSVLNDGSGYYKAIGSR